jgi:UDP-N-acetylmuramoyl-L-alanyl-D-glutamate--2,6-diaminopimelate ligase
MAVVAPGWTGELALRLAGRFNVHNALAAVALGIGWELDLEAVRAGLEALTGVPGRMERIERGQPFTVIVDFAHSPAALHGVLDELGPVAAAAGGGLIAVFGSAGERDTAKRPMMGRIAGERCRLVVLTDEDPRSEDRLVILDEIAVGAEAAGRRRGRDLLLIPDRATAIADALGRARPGDVIVFAGKGHETTIEGPDGPLSWDERAAVEHALAALGFRDGD